MNEHFSPEHAASIEDNEKVKSRIVLHFLRHGEKGKAKEGQPNRTVPLTPQGKAQAVEKGQQLENRDPAMYQSVAFGSSRERSQHTASLTMAGKFIKYSRLEEDRITGEETLEELRQKIDEGKKIGSQIGIDPRLDFTHDKETEFGKMTDQATKDGALLKLIVEESDEWARKSGNKDNICYSRQAGQVAQIIQKYAGISTRWNQLVEKRDYDDTLYRFMGTHHPVGESFLAKVIELTKGIEERDRFVAALNNQGFDFTEGFDVEITQTGDSTPEVRVIFKKERDGKTIYELNEIVPSDTLEEVIKQGQGI